MVKKYRYFIEAYKQVDFNEVETVNESYNSLSSLMIRYFKLKEENFKNIKLFRAELVPYYLREAIEDAEMETKL